MEAFLINLDHSADRLRYMQAQFSRLKLDVERVSAIWGLNVPDWLAPEFEDTNLTPGEVGCYASHLIACQMIVAQELPYALVLEDDTELSDDFPGICASLLPWHAPKGWDCIHLATAYKVAVKRVSGLTNERDLVRFIRQPSGTTAYLISNQGARKWLAPRQRRLPADVDNRQTWPEGNVYGVYPPLGKPSPQFRSIIEARGARPHPISLRARMATLREIGPLTYGTARLLDFWNSIRRKIDGKRRIAVLG